jgi:protein-arginine kinase activator protein McsA
VKLKGFRPGKVPRALQLGRDLETRIHQLQKRLEQAVAAEDFEEARRLAKKENKPILAEFVIK